MADEQSTDEKVEHGAATAEDGSQPVAGWRRAVGVTLFVLHLVLPLIALIVVPILGLPSGTNAILMGASVVGGPDVLLIVAIAILGKDGVSDLMAKFGSVVRRITKWDAVTERRYRIGMWVLLASLVLPTAILFFWSSSIESIEGEAGWGFWLLLASTFAFIGSVLCMGQPFWLRVQAIVTWDAKILIPAPAADTNNE
ncbi:MAG: hypothetical protein ACR2N9_06835 [Acidimicrobiia bacterium]